MYSGFGDTFAEQQARLIETSELVSKSEAGLFGQQGPISHRCVIIFFSQSCAKLCNTDRDQIPRPTCLLPER